MRIEWSRHRVTFGKPLAERQGITFPIVDQLTQVEAARLLIRKAMWLSDRGLDCRREAAMVKAWVPSLATRICHESLLTIGNVAYSREHVAQLRLRDAISAELGDGAANIQRILLTRDVFGTDPS